MILQLVAYTDPGHGWLKVTRKLLIELGIENQITAYSYQSKSGKIVYLEEDADVSLFANTLKAKGWSFQNETKYSERSHVRSLPRFKAVT